MDEEHNENELEERLYAMLHHVDETQNNVNDGNQDAALCLVESTPRSTVRRYWRTSGDYNQPLNTPHQKINNPKEPAAIVNKNTTTNKPHETKPKVTTTDLSIFQSNPQNVQSSIEILENDNNHNIVELETSDEDEVIEVALPPKPTITIESSDDEGNTVLAKPSSPAKPEVKPNSPPEKSTGTDREVSASPVPSVVSSVSDEFIRGDCIALNISSRHPDNHSFDFSLHGSDLLGHSTPSKKKKKKKVKESSTPASKEALDVSVASVNMEDELFATPKSKAKNKKQKNKSFNVSDKSVPSADVYDSDSNQSIIDTNKPHSYVVSEKSLPNTDVYESDSNQSETSSNNKKKQNTSSDSDCRVVPDKPAELAKSWRTMSFSNNNETTTTVIDLTDKNMTNNTIEEDFIIGNVTGFKESDDYDNESIQQTDNPVLGSTKVPAILYEDLDFDNLKGKANVCTKRKYSLSTLRAEMEKFYNESWGGEDFNHREIQKSMSRDKSLWVIDPKDRMPTPMKRKVACNYCNRVGHRDDACRSKPPVCHMCGSVGHYEPRCPSKICVNCGSPNHMYSTMCRNCATWGRVTCAECGQRGHPASHCPDLWRRYHNTIEEDSRLEESRQMKKHFQLFCSGCTRRGHLVHTCRLTIPFSGLPINSPYVSVYRPIYFPRADKRSFQPDSTNVSTPFRNERNKRQSKSPTTHETHVNKKRNISASEDGRRQTKSPQQRSVSMSDDIDKNLDTQVTEKALDFIPIGSTNRDKKGQIIQDNEVSDTSDVVTSARIYVTADIIDQLKTEDGKDWLNETTKKLDVIVENTDITSFLSLKGKVADQENFQAALRDWSRGKSGKEHHKSENEANVSQENDNDQSLSENIPKNRNNVLRKLGKALDSLKDDLGDPKDIYKELNYLQNRHEQLLKQKVISPKQVSNNRNHIKDMLKKLNMVLLGQAGLGEGSQHLTELYSLQEKLTNLRHKNIPQNLRKEIGQHYHCIFTALPRDDYVDLLKSYYSPTQAPASFKRKKKIKLNPKVVCKNKINTIPLSPPKQLKNNRANTTDDSGAEQTSPVVQRTVNKLVFYHRRLMNSRPTGKILKKTRLELVRKLHTHIASLFRTANASSKVMKKIKKVQEQAQLFLSNV